MKFVGLDDSDGDAWEDMDAQLAAASCFEADLAKLQSPGGSSSSNPAADIARIVENTISNRRRVDRSRFKIPKDLPLTSTPKGFVYHGITRAASIKLEADRLKMIAALPPCVEDKVPLTNEVLQRIAANKERALQIRAARRSQAAVAEVMFIVKLCLIICMPYLAKLRV